MLPSCMILELTVHSVSCLQRFPLCNNTTLTFDHRPWKTIGIFLSPCLSNVRSCKILELTVQPTRPGQTDGRRYTIKGLVEDELLKRAGPFIWTNLNSLHYRMQGAKFCWIWLISVLLKKNFKFRGCIFAIRNYFPLKMVCPFISTNLNFLHPRLLCSKFGWNWPICFWEDF